MRAVVTYESMYGNTRAIAEAIGRGLADAYEVTVEPAATILDESIKVADLVVLGAPTHAHTWPSARSRTAARQAAAKHPELVLQGAASRLGIRELLAERPVTGRVAVFDTRIDMPRFLTGQAGKRIARAVRHGGGRVLDRETFLVDKHNRLVDGEIARAEAWGRGLARTARWDHELTKSRPTDPLAAA